MISVAKWLGRKTTAVRIHCNGWRLRLRRSRRRRANQRRLDLARDRLRINIDSEAGLFAHLSWCLKIAAYCERRGLAPRITCTSKQYGDGGRDWLNALFELPPPRPATTAAPANACPALCLFEYEELPFYADAALDLTLAEATRLQRKYFPVSKRILAKVDAFVARHFCPASGVTIGCHFRGTDKGGVEAARIAYDEMTAELRRALAAHSRAGAALFIATDEAAFLEHARAAFPDTVVLSADHRRSADGRALHFSRELHGLASAGEALTDCLLLSRCDMLVKSPSALSAWSKVFNPALPVTLIGRPYPHKMFFPESALVEQADNNAAAASGRET